MNVTGMRVNSRIACAPRWRSIQRLLDRRPSVQKDLRTRVKRHRTLANRQHKLPLSKPYREEPYEPMNSTLPIAQSGYFLTGVASNLLFAVRIALLHFCAYSQQKEPRREAEL